MAYIKFRPLTTGFNFTHRLNSAELTERETELIDSGEKILVAIKAIVDVGLITNKRIILINNKPLTKKREVYSCPYESISTFSFISGRINSAIKLTFSSGYTTKINFLRDSDNKTISEVYKILSTFVLK